ncbi:MAG: hypothetical protein WCA49_16845 [Candidatus Sulfotelmatobacter sp.]
MAAEAEPGFFGNALGIRIDGAQKFLDLLRNLFIAVRDALTWLDVMWHFRLHSHSPEKLARASKKAATTVHLNTHEAGKFRFGGTPKISRTSCPVNGTLVPLFELGESAAGPS